MGNVNFYLKKPEPKTGRSLIILQFEYSRRKLTFSTKQNIDPKKWDKRKQRVKNTRQASADGDFLLNDLLDSLERELQNAYKKELKDGIPEPSKLKVYLQTFFNRNKVDESAAGKTLYALILRFIAGEIRHQGKDKEEATLKKYKTVYNHLKAFEKERKYRVDYDTIDLNFFDKYVSYLKALPVRIIDRQGVITIQKGLKTNSIAKDITILKTFMNYAVERGETNNLEYKKRSFHVAQEETDAVFLSESELMQLYRYDFSDNKRLDQVRDLFIFGAYVGLRFSDYSSVKPEHIVVSDGQYFIRIITRKTKELVVIPCHPIIREIFDKYKDSPNRLPKSLSNQKFNQYIKEACEVAGLIETGRLITDPTEPLCNCVSSHTCRRSFATNFYLQGFPTIDLMKITGHRTEGAFLKYIRVSKLDAAKRLAVHMQNQWENMHIQVS